LCNVVEEGGDGVLIGTPGDVGDEKGIALRADNIAVLLGAVVSGTATLGVVVGSLLGEVQSHVAAVEKLAVLRIVGLLCGLGGGEVDVAEATGSASGPVGDDTSAE
jgi:hypothetical protein